MSGLAALALLLPNLSVAIRRLHDINRSGWWILIFIDPDRRLHPLAGLVPARGRSGRERLRPASGGWHRADRRHRLGKFGLGTERGPARPAQSSIQGIIARDQCISRHSYGRNLPLRTISTRSPLSSGSRRTVKPKLIALMIPSPNSSWINSFSAGP